MGATLFDYPGAGVTPRVPWRATDRLLCRCDLDESVVSSLLSSRCNIVRSEWGHITPICINGRVYAPIRAGMALRVDPLPGASDTDRQEVRQILTGIISSPSFR